MPVLSTQTKLLILFLSDDNPLWDTVLVSPTSVGKISAYMDLAIGTIENWKIGKGIKESTVDAAFATILKMIQNPPESLFSSRSGRSKKLNKKESPSICKPLDETQKSTATRITNIFRDSIKMTFRHSKLPGIATGADQSNKPFKSQPETSKIYHVGNLVGMSMKQCQKIIDEIIYERFTILPNFCYSSVEDANASLKRFLGTYDVWVKRGERWLQSRLRVRYIIDVRNRLAIRCKMNFPILREEPYEIPYFEYDGFLRVHDGKVFWIFEKRELEGTDFFYFITSKGMVHERNGDKRFTMSGKYLTTGQDKHSSITTETLLLQLISSGDDETEEDMHDLRKIRVINEPTEIAELDIQSDEFQSACAAP